jgi:alkanesulfonate monooxygenase SsuD/methylene tetrahydromethanopterin reductase-like flavin-dependent oxidoreductase (luciferase family)
LAQYFGTLDKRSNGRMIIGLGSNPQVIEHYSVARTNGLINCAVNCFALLEYFCVILGQFLTGAEFSREAALCGDSSDAR